MADQTDNTSPRIRFPILEPEQLRGLQLPFLQKGAPAAIQAETFHSMQHRLDEMLTALDARESDLYHVKVELAEARVSFQRDREAMHDMERRIIELEDIIEKQRMTINLQSRTISGPGPAIPRTKPRAMSCGFSTPEHHPFNQEGPRVSHFQHVFSQPPPKFGLASLQTQANAPAFGRIQAPPTSIAPAAAAAAGGGGGSAAFMSPIDRLNAFLPPLVPSPAVEEKLVAMSSLPAVAPEGSMVMEAASLNGKDFAAMLKALFKKTETFGQTYVSTSDATVDNAIDPDIQGFLQACSHPSALPTFQRDPKSRTLLLIKAINLYLVIKVLHICVLFGFDTTADSEIEQMLDLVFPAASANVRVIFYEAIRLQVNRIRNKPLFCNFYNKRKSENAKSLFGYIQHLVQRNHPTIWGDFVELIEEAHSLAIIMFSGPYEFHMRFAEVGDLFDMKTMCTRKTGGICDTMDPRTLMKGCYRVKLGIAPTIVFRDNAAPGTDAMPAIFVGDVLLMPPGSEAQ
ncbi:hypothetical protein ACO22_01441 [Paracoccidioides brasiliensis]|uniref:Uncharacterized protein n=1 Tax=Paracoccidioides brasiliensis TaxID=121759 RepID=A0A1D2JLT6_PARBR|nr:hypothetical protein ACO22_01441 [Paracoccidioides brasiliensis]